MSRVTVGPGDEATWGPCVGHPNDPRTEDSNAYCINGTWYDFDSTLTQEEVAELLEEGEERCEAAGLVWQMVLDEAILLLRSRK